MSEKDRMTMVRNDVSDALKRVKEARRKVQAGAAPGDVYLDLQVAETELERAQDTCRRHQEDVAFDRAVGA